MLRNLLESWPTEVTLAPCSGIQFLDFSFDREAGGRGSIGFSERIAQRTEEGDVWRLHPMTGDPELDNHVPPAREEGEEDYSVSRVRALEPFLDKWTPAPVLRIRPGRGPGGEEHYDPGPSTWARIYITELDAPDPKTGHTHRAILALDTDLADQDEAPEGPDDPYLTPGVQDAADERAFRLVCDPAQIGWFLRRPVTEDGEEYDQQKWVDDWLRHQFQAFRAANVRPGRAVPEERYRFEHWARYLAMLRLLHDAIRPPRLRLLDTVSEDNRYPCVDVDLVLDIGNSRTCGILIENHPDESRVDLNNSYVLAMRDLSRPEMLHREPFESRVEFAHAEFGPDSIARRSGRSRPAFMWPSLVRVGAEATRLVSGTKGTETLSGLSSPKRYLWDIAPTNQDWRFHGADARQALPIAARSSFRFLNEAGDVIEQAKAEQAARLRDPKDVSTTGAIRPRFSRSSLYGLMVSELITQAMVQINDPAGRATRRQADLPRRLRNVILTLPSATPIQEQAIMRSRAEGAVRLIWSVQDWSASRSSTCRMPEVKIDWDEASCTQLVWLFDEITQKFGGRISALFDLKGRRRSHPDGGRAVPSIRVGCIDVGGGTTDMMVTTFYSEEDREIRPRQNMREGFRTAGDDIVEEVVARIVLPSIRTSIEAAGASYAEDLLRELFGGDVGDLEEQTRQRRRQFALQVLLPAALAVLSASESLRPGERRALPLTDILGTHHMPDLESEDGADGSAARDPYAWQAPEEEAAPPKPELLIEPDLLAYLETPARDRGARGWSLADLVVEADQNLVEDVIRDVMSPSLDAMMELIDSLDVDVLLLSGRPTRLAPLRDLVREAMALRPDRIVPMHQYKIGAWYPYRDRVSSRIGDPKSTAAVGAMLCLLASGRIVNFTLDAEAIAMADCALYVGEMERHGRIDAQRVLFSPPSPGQPDQGQEAEVLLRSPIHIGFRQLPIARWPASPLYRLDFANENAQRLRTPLNVMLSRRESEGDAEDEAARLRAEALKEAFLVEEVTDADGDRVSKNDVKLTLHTLGVDEQAYWLDSGVFRLG